MRLHETPDSSVRHTKTLAHLHPECGAELLDDLAQRRDEQVERWTWGHGPRALATRRAA